MKAKSMRQPIVSAMLGAVLLAHAPMGVAGVTEAQALQERNGVLHTYRRLLPLEGSSNFRDLGGYKTQDGRTVRRGLLFRSGVMTWLSEEDQDWLSRLGVDAVVDLRSREELELFPNRWVQSAGIDYITHDYSITDMLGNAADSRIDVSDMGSLYRRIAYSIVPQLRLYFDRLLTGEAPVVVNCSAGQDRTGIASALLLTALGVPREVVVEDYLLSSDFRRPRIERGQVDLEAAAAEGNAFAALMARYSDADESMLASPLVTADGVPYLSLAFESIEQDYGSVEAFLDEEIGVDAEALQRLRRLYLQ